MASVTVTRRWALGDGTHMELARDEVILRFWTGPELPDFEAARTWCQYKQVVYTDRIDFPKFCDNVTVKHLDVVDVEAAPQLKKDFHQFDVVKDAAGLFLDFDVRLIDPAKIPNSSHLIGSELVKKAGAQLPTELLPPPRHYRIHLGMTRFPRGDPIAAEIAGVLRARLDEPGVEKIIKGHRKWMDNTLEVQRIWVKHALPVPEPLVVNPWPLWLKNKKNVGKLLFGVQMPTIAEVLCSSATVNTWHGYDFPFGEILQMMQSSLSSGEELSSINSADSPPTKRLKLTKAASSVPQAASSVPQAVDETVATKREQFPMKAKWMKELAADDDENKAEQAKKLLRQRDDLYKKFLADKKTRPGQLQMRLDEAKGIDEKLLNLRDGEISTLSASTTHHIDEIEKAFSGELFKFILFHDLLDLLDLYFFLIFSIFFSIFSIYTFS